MTQFLWTPAPARLLMAAAAAGLLTLSGARQASAQHKPYEPLPVTYDRAAESDASLRALIESLRAAVAEKNLGAIDAALAPSLMTYECDADPVKPCPAPAPAAAAPPAQTASNGAVKAPGLAKPLKIPKPAAARPDPRLAMLQKIAPAQRLRMGLCCRDVPAKDITNAMRDETALGIVGAALEEETVGSHPDLPGAMCMPAWPMFDRAKAAQIAASSNVDNANLRVSTAEIALRQKPTKDAPEAAKIATGQLVPFVTEAVDSLPDGWNSIALPQGGLGFTDQGGMTDLTPAGLCFAKDEAGAWKISVVVQRHS